MASVQHPRISVAMCTYNGERFVEEQLLSILGQDLVPDEVVICDDGSSDGTVSAIRRVIESTSSAVEVRLVATDRVGGVTANFERAVRACRADVIALCDQDDVWHADRLSGAIPSFNRRTGPLLVFSDALLVGERGEPLEGTLHERLRLRRTEARLIDQGHGLEVLLRRNVATGAATMFSSDLLASALPFPASWVHDEWLTIIAAAVGEVRRSDKTLISYRLHGDNQIGVNDPGVGSRLGRMFEPRQDRYRRLNQRSLDLVARLSELDVAPRTLALARRKVVFESARAEYPQSRLRRIAPVARQCALGNYRRLSSQRNLDLARDLLQPS